MICRICGEEKPRESFYRLKNFNDYIHDKKIWCRNCMKLYVLMMKEKKQLKELREKELFFSVRFE